MSGCFDGASVNMGCKTGVAARLRQDVPNIVTIHCCSHRLELAVKDVMNSVPYYDYVNTFFNDLYKAYHCSSLMWSGLRIACEAFQIVPLKPQCVYGTRWLPHYERAVAAVIRDYPALVEHLTEVTNSGSTQSSRDVALKLVTVLKSIRFVAFLTFLVEYLSLLANVSKVFQDNATTVDKVHIRITSVKEKLNSLANVATLQKLLKSGFIQHNEDIKYKGIISERQEGRRGRCDKQRTAQSLLQEVEHDCLNIIKSTQDHMSIRFDSFVSNPVLSAAHTLEYRNWPNDEELKSYGDEQIRNIYHNYKSCLDKGGSLQETLLQWTELKKVIRRRYGSKFIRCDELWIKTLKEDIAEERFKQILQLVKIILVMPIHTAECERGFSLMGNIKNDWRARLISETVTNLMAIKLSQYTFETYNPAGAIFQWMESGKRYRRPSTMPYGPRKKAQN